MMPFPLYKKFSNWLVVLLFVFNFSNEIFGQSKIDSLRLCKNTFFIELFGNCPYGSLNYDRILVKKGPNAMSLRFGILPYHKITSLASATFELNYLNGLKNCLEGSIGVTFVHGVLKETSATFYNETTGSGNLFLFPKVGYRFQKENGGLFFKTGIGAYIKLVELYTYDRIKYGGGFLEINSTIWFNLGLGYTFRSCDR